MKAIKLFFTAEAGLELSEYAVAAALIVAGIIVAFSGLGAAITNQITALANTISGS